MILLLLRILWTFFTIGLLGFGGGYSMVSMMQAEMVTNHQWMTLAQFTDIMAISQSSPGPLAINCSTHMGYTCLINAGYTPEWAVLGALVATSAMMLPSLTLMLIICKFLWRYRNSPVVENVFSGIRPAVVGVLAAATLLLLSSENFGNRSELPWQFYISLLLFIFAFIARRTYKMSPITILALCGIAGILLL